MASYETGSIIGRGGFATVYRGTFRTANYGGYSVAIKRAQLISLSIEGDEIGDREKNIMSQLLHNNVVQLLHVQDKGEFRFYVLELCDGSLDDYFKGEYQGTRIEDADADALNQMARGLRYIHRQKLIHRDVKPDNVLISAKPSVILFKISDFGLSKRSNDQDSLSLSGCRGTFNYMAPELLKLVSSEDNEGTLKRGSLAADVFSMGIVFFCLLTKGKHPFDEGMSELTIPSNIIQDKRDLTAIASGPWCHLVEKMLAAEATDRPAMAEICSQLKKQQPNSPPEIEGRRRSCYDLNEGKIVHCCRFHPTKPKLACGLDGGRICLFSGESHVTPLSEWNRQIWKAAGGHMWCIDWKVDGSKLAAGCGGGKVVVWEEDGTKSFDATEHSNIITCIQWNNEDRSHLFVTGSEDKVAIVWDSDQKVALQVFQFHSDQIRQVRWISANQFASCSHDRTVQICQLDRSDPLITFRHENMANALQWNESDRLVSCSGGKSIKIWSLDEDEPLATLRASESSISCFDWHRRIGAEGAGSVRWWIVGGCQNNDVLLWDMEVDGLATEPRKLAGHSDWVRSVAFSPDGQFLASGDGCGMAIIWWTKMWASISHIQTGTLYPWHQLNFNSTGNKLAIPNGSPEVVVVEFGDEEPTS